MQTYQDIPQTYLTFSAWQLTVKMASEEKEKKHEAVQGSSERKVVAEEGKGVAMFMLSTQVETGSLVSGVG